VNFEQSTFFANLLSPERLSRQRGDHAPTLGLEGEVDRYLLSRMDGQTALEAIARDAADRFPERIPERFPDWRAALTRAGELSVKYGKKPSQCHSALGRGGSP
jgi:hypothetical protein